MNTKTYSNLYNTLYHDIPNQIYILFKYRICIQVNGIDVSIVYKLNLYMKWFLFYKYCYVHVCNSMTLDNSLQA